MNKEKKEVNQSLGVLAKSAIVVFMGLILSKVFSYIYRIVIARVYGPDIYGIFLLASSIVGLLVYVVLMGFDGGVVRYIPLYKSRRRNENIKFIINFGFWTTIIIGVIIGVLLFLLADIISINLFHEPRLTFFLKIFSVLIPVIALTNYFLAIINSYEKIVITKEYDGFSQAQGHRGFSIFSITFFLTCTIHQPPSALDH